MSENHKCPECGSELAPGAEKTPCPGCLMKLGLESWTDRRRGGTGRLTPLGKRFVPPEPQELAKLFPQLEIIDLVGKGGMGAVYKARQRGLDRLVAVKILPAEIGTDPAFAERFAREARALARLNHPNIVSVYDYGQADRLYYFVMEYVDGANLRQLVGEQSPDPPQALALVSQICDALQFAHDEGIVHRDIKPENIMVDRRGRAKIADFGLAKLLSKGPAETALTQDRQAMGTLHYMAPEQMEGSKGVDHRADLYSLGVVFYELLTGELPLGRFALPSSTVHVDVRLDEIVLRSLEREPERRYQRASEIKTDIQSVSDGSVNGPEPLAAPPQTAADGLGKRESPSAAPQRLTTATVPAEPPRFSRKAIVGALWATLFLPLVVAVAPAFMTVNVSHPVHSVAAPSSPSLPILLLLIVGGLFTLLAGSSVLGTTILGLLAIRDIRRSDGRIMGLPLALADAMLFPLLLLDVLIAAVLIALMRTFAMMSHRPPLGEALLWSIVIVWLVVDALLIWWAWQSVRHPEVPPADPQWALPGQPAPPAKLAGDSDSNFQTSRGGAASWAVGATLVLLLLIGAAATVAKLGGFSTSPTSRLARALRYGDTQAVIRLIEANPRLLETRNAEGLTPLSVAAQRGNAWLVEVLRERGAEIDTVDARGETPLMKAVGTGTFGTPHERVASYLIEHGAEINHRDAQGRTVLMHALGRGIPTIAMLLANGANVDIPDNDGTTPLMLSAASNRPGEVQMLLERKATVDPIGKDGATPLLEASARGSLPTVVALVEHGADVNHTTPAGDTALIRAVAGGHGPMVEYLLTHGADVQRRDANGRSVLHHAANAEIYQRLRDAGAPVGRPELFYEGYKSAIAGRYADAATSFEQAREIDSAASSPLQAHLYGWEYEIANPDLTLTVLLADCYARGGDKERARQILSDDELPWPDAGSVTLYQRRQDSSGREVSEQYELSRAEFDRFQKSPDKPLTLRLQRREVTKRGAGNNTRRRSSESHTSVSGAFHY